jgi:hypothetical protein
LLGDRPQEAIYVVPGVDRVTVIFSTIFKEETDRIFGKVFLQVPFTHASDGKPWALTIMM